MKKLFLLIFFAMSIGLNMRADSQQKLFAYPEPPKDMTGLYERCNFLVYKFWDPCDFKSAFSSKAKLNAAFGDWLSFMPYASADTVYMAIDNLYEKVKKSAPHTLEITKMAESWLYSDTAEYRSDELYLHFVDNAIACKKLSSEDKKYFAAQKLILDNSSVGSAIPNLELTKADGSKISFYDDSTAIYSLLMIYEPDCMDCTFARVRLSADMVLNQLNDQGVVRMITLYAGEPDAAFSEAVASFPEKWLNVASPEVRKYFNVPQMPALYYLDKDHKIVGKNLNLDNVLNVFRSMIK